MNGNVKIQSPWAQLGLFLRFLGLALLGLVVLSLPLSLLPKPLSSTTLRLEQMLSTILLFGVPAYFYARLTFVDRPLYRLGFRPAERASFYILGVLLLLLAIPFESWLGILNKNTPLPKWMIQSEDSTERQLMTMLEVKNSFDIVFNLLVVAVIPGIFEEMFFRGVVQRLMIQLTKRPWVGIVVAAFIFSFFHFQFQGFLPRMFLGILLGAAFWYSGSLWVTAIAHCFYNGIQVLALVYYPDAMTREKPSIPVYTVLLSLVIVVGLLAVMRKSAVQGRSIEG